MTAAHCGHFLISVHVPTTVYRAACHERISIDTRRATVTDLFAMPATKCTHSASEARLAEFSATLATITSETEPLDTLQRLLLRERRTGAKRNSSYLQSVQRDGMAASWRQKMSHWMFETGSAFEMAKDTVGCAINYMDQYLSLHSATKHNLQLLSLVSLSAASKMHESQPISMDEMKVLSENKFSRKELWQMEAQLMQALSWKLDPLTPFTFARDLLASLAIQDTAAVLDLVMPFLQDVTEDYASLCFSASSIAIVAVFMFTKSHSSDVMSSFASVLSSLEIDSSELVDCFHFLADFNHVKNHASPISVAEVTEVDGFSVANSPCSVDSDLCDDLCSPVWAIDFYALLEKPVVEATAESGDCCPRSKKMRAN